MKPLMYFASKEMCEVVVRLFFQCVDLQLFFFTSELQIPDSGYACKSLVLNQLLPSPMSSSRLQAPLSGARSRSRSSRRINFLGLLALRLASPWLFPSNVSIHLKGSVSCNRKSRQLLKS